LGEDSSMLHASISEKVDFSKFNKIYLIGKEMKHLSEALNEKHIENEWFIDWQASLTEVKKEIKKENIVFFKASNGMDFSGLIAALED
jgi:UDP-N-acetylmuramoyl-tripeptide--D-alanyl-D-alanine ligase